MHPRLEAFRVAQKCKIGALGFLQQNSDVWPLVLPVAETKVLMELKENDSLYDVQDTLQRLIQLPVGQKLFGWLWKTVARQAMKKHVSDELTRLAALDTVTEAEINESQASVMMSLESFSDLPEMSAKRVVEVVYGSLTVKVEVKSLLSELIVHYAAFVKSSAVRAGTLRAFGPEAEMVGAVSASTNDGPNLDKGMVAKYEQARLAAETILAAKNHTDSAESMEVEVSKN
eukprot:6479322-Amphidinium_carterae.1